MQRTATITDLDKCQRFDEITAKFGGKKTTSLEKGSHRNMPMPVELYSDTESGVRRFSTGRLAGFVDSFSRRPDTRREHSVSDAPELARENATDPKLSDTLKFSGSVSEKARNRRASSFDPKTGRSNSFASEDEYHNRAPFSNGESLSTTKESSLSSANGRDGLDSEKEVVFTSTEVLALRLMFSMYDRSGTATIEYEDLVAYAQETGK